MLPVFIMAIENDDDRTFVAELYARCQPAMQRRALSILKNESDAEEAVHEAILRVIRHLEKVRMIPRDEVLYYLVTVTETASIDLYRKRQRESRATIGNENDWAEHLTDDNTAEQAMLRLEQEAAGEAAVPPAQDNVIRAAFRRVTWEEARGTVLYGAKKAVSCVAVVFLTIAVAATTTFALSPAEKKQSILERVLYTIRYYTDKWTSHGGTRVEYPHFYYEDFEYIEVPNEEVWEALEIWASFRNVTNFNDGANISISHLLQMMFYYCDAYGLEYPYVDASTKWVQREALLEFGAYFFGITQEDLDQQVKMRPLYYDAQRDAYCDLNYDYSYQFAEINATEKMGLIRYTENEDGTLTLEVVTKSMDSWEGYCNYPTLLTVDFSAGHPVFRSAVVADLTQYWEFPPEPEEPLF